MLTTKPRHRADVAQASLYYCILTVLADYGASTLAGSEVRMLGIAAANYGRTADPSLHCRRRVLGVTWRQQENCHDPYITTKLLKRQSSAS